MIRNEKIEKLACELNSAMRGLTPIEKALVMVQAFRDVYGGVWVIDASSDGTFTVRRKRQ